MYSPGHSRLISTGLYLPQRRVFSNELMERINSAERFGLSADWLQRTTGICERRIADVTEKSSDLAARAALEALDRGKTLASDVDAIIYCGVLRDHVEPATAHIVQHKIGANRAVAFDISNACLGFMNAMHLMDSLIATGQVRRGLVVTGERGSHYLEKAIEVLSKTEDRTLFDDIAAGLTLGDAGAAAILGPKIDPETGFLGFMAESHGEFHELCVCGKNGEDTVLTTKIREIVRETTKLVGPIYKILMEEHLKWRPADLNKYIPHQVGLRSVKKHAEVADISLGIIPITVNYLGNIISATIPANIHLLLEQGKLGNGERVYLSGTGSGISLSQAGLIWDAA
ncbi:MAG: 3-oxoacyl-ACP synthase III family protein [Acidiferrobacterales bacterium]